LQNPQGWATPEVLAAQAVATRGMSKTFKHSPFQEPQAWVRQIVRNGVYLSSLEEWIKYDLVFATAFPLSFFDPLKQQHVQEMRKRAANISDERWEEITRDTIESQFYSSFTPAELSTMEPAKSEEVASGE